MGALGYVGCDGWPWWMMGEAACRLTESPGESVMSPKQHFRCLLMLVLGGFGFLAVIVAAWIALEGGPPRWYGVLFLPDLLAILCLRYAVKAKCEKCGSKTLITCDSTYCNASRCVRGVFRRCAVAARFPGEAWEGACREA